MKINDTNYTGLSTNDVLKRKEAKQINISKDNITKTYKEIFLSNTITFFNIINFILLAMVLSVGSYKNTLFIFIITINTTAGIYQEIRAKKTLDKLSILTTNTVDVVRNDNLITIPINEIVLDDLIVLLSGYQIPADATIIEGQLEVDESLLTGEADAIQKIKGDNLFSGSFVTSGKALCQIIHVGDDNYSQQITLEAKKFKRHNSDLNRCLNQILKSVSIVIIPIAVLLFLKQFYVGHLPLSTAVLNTVAACLGMIPEGLVLLTSVALTLSVLRLAKQKTLVQELFCIETLARVDMLCLDKTGTITEGKIQVDNVEVVNDVNVDEVIGNMLYCLEDNNVTAIALEKYFPNKLNYTPHYIIPFSSSRKYSGVSFEQIGSYYLGAVEFLFPNQNNEFKNKCDEYASKGHRIIVLAFSKQLVSNDDLPNDLIPCAIILMSDVLRKDAKETLAYFEAQGVTTKVISGDNPITVSMIAKKAGMKNADKYIDATTLNTHEEIKDAVNKYSVFGRVTPKQKKEMIVCLKELNHTVAMTGDGVNDVLAFKEADCSIAMASGSSAAKHAANLVLLDNNFDAMPHIVNEGRRVINNISMSASMFLIKTIFSAILATITILIGNSYPFEPIQLSIISGCAVGIPTFFLTYESSFEKFEGGFLKKVLKNAFPTAIIIAIITSIIMNVGLAFKLNHAMLSTICVIFTGWNYQLALKRIYSPITTYRKIIIYTTQLAYFIAMIIGQKILNLTTISFNGILVLIAAMYFSPLMVEGAQIVYDKIVIKYNYYKINKRKNLS